MEEVENVLSKHAMMRWQGEAHCSCGWMHEVPHLRNAVGHGGHLSEMLEPLFASAWSEGRESVGLSLLSPLVDGQRVPVSNPYRKETE